MSPIISYNTDPEICFPGMPGDDTVSNYRTRLAEENIKFGYGVAASTTAGKSFTNGILPEDPSTVIGVASQHHKGKKADGTCLYEEGDDINIMYIGSIWVVIKTGEVVSDMGSLVLVRTAAGNEGEFTPTQETGAIKLYGAQWDRPSRILSDGVTVARVKLNLPSTI